MKAVKIFDQEIKDLLIALAKIPDSEAVRRKFTIGTIRLNLILYKFFTGKEHESIKDNITLSTTYVKQYKNTSEDE